MVKPELKNFPPGSFSTEGRPIWSSLFLTLLVFNVLILCGHRPSGFRFFPGLGFSLLQYYVAMCLIRLVNM